MKDAGKRREREQKELQALKKRRDAKPYRGYMAVIFVLITAVYVIDEVSSNIRTNLQSSIVNDFFVNGQGLTYGEGLSKLSSLTLVSLVFMIVNPFYKALADKYGRKPFLVINTLGMAVGLVLGLFSTSYPIYVLGTVLTTFFISHDMQVTYAMEIAPADKRATFFSVTKCVANVGLAIVPLSRWIFMGNDDSRWRLVFIIPAVLGLAIVVCCIIFARETPTYLNQRIALLEKPYEQRLAESEEAKKNKKVDEGKTGIVAGWKYTIQHKPLRMVMLSGILGAMGVLATTTYYESIMRESGMTTESITTALFFYPFIYAILLLVDGFLSDRFGRKPVIAITTTIASVSLVLFIVGCRAGWSEYVVGFLQGLYLSSFYQSSDHGSIQLTEYLPTRIRISASSAMGIPGGIAMIAGMVLCIVLLNFMPVHIMVLVLALPTLIIPTIVRLIYLPETRGVDLDQVQG